MCLRLVAGLAVLCSVGTLGAYAATLCVNPGGKLGCKATINAALSRGLNG